MLKALLKKQFRELGMSLFPTHKKDKNGNLKTRSRGAYVAIYIVLFVSLIITFSGLSLGLSIFLNSELGLSSLYFSIIGTVAILFGVFGSVFSTYASLYLAKDNDTLLAMPIPPAALLFVRMLTVFVMGAFYALPVWIPGVAVYAFMVGFSPIAFLCQILVYLLICIFICFLSALLGFVVAEIASRLKNKSVLAAIFLLAFLAVYYLICFRMGMVMNSIIEYAAEIDAFVMRYLGFFAWLGAAACGKGLELLFFALVVLALFALLYWVLSKTFLAISTRKVGEKKAVYHEKTARKGSVSSALLKKEWKRFIGSVTYLLNAGFGVLMVPILAVLLAIKSGDLLPALESMGLTHLLAVIPYLLPAMVLTMNAVSAPSVSLEGKMLWQLKTLPVTAWQVLRAKLSLHLLVNAPFGVSAALFLGVWFGLDVFTILLSAAAVFCVIALSALWGLFWGLKKPMMDWTNESYPIKQSAPVLFAVLGSMAISATTGVVGIILCGFLHPAVYYLLLIAALSVPTILLSRWVKNKGTVIFEEL